MRKVAKPAPRVTYPVLETRELPGKESTMLAAFFLGSTIDSRGVRLMTAQKGGSRCGKKYSEADCREMYNGRCTPASSRSRISR